MYLSAIITYLSAIFSRYYVPECNYYVPECKSKQNKQQLKSCISNDSANSEKY